MESSSSKMGAMKPALLTAGIPLAITLAGCVFAKIAARRSCFPKASPPEAESQSNIDQETESCETKKDGQEDFDSQNSPCVEADQTQTEVYYRKNAVESSVVKQDEIFGLRRRIEEIQDRERQLEKRFLCYQELKDEEMVLMELQSKLSLQLNKVEFFTREISFLEAENKRFEAVVMEYLKVSRLLEFSRSENEQLRRRAQKLSRRTNEQSRVLRKQRLQIEFQDKEITKNEKELEVKTDSIRLMEDEIKELKRITGILQEEKNELSSKLRAAQESATSKVEEETVTIEKYNELAREVERMRKDEAAQVRELIYVRWCNACLWHELMSRNEEQVKMEENDELEIDYGGMEEIDGFGSDNELNRCSRVGHHSKRRRLIAKFKRWVEGGEKNKHSSDEKEHVNKCFRRHRSVSDGAEEACFHPLRLL